MWTRQAALEARNYWNDPRVKAAQHYANMRGDEERMVLFLAFTDDEGDEVEHEVPAKYVVCPACDGKGRHVDPQVDAGGYYSDDQDEEDGYFRGAYTVTCHTCAGKRVVMEVDAKNCDKALLERWRDYLEECEEYDAVVRAERMLGC